MFARWAKKFEDAISTSKPSGSAATAAATATAPQAQSLASAPASTSGGSYFIDMDSKKNIQQLLDELVTVTADLQNGPTLNHHKTEKTLKENLPMLVEQGRTAGRTSTEFKGTIVDAQLASQSVSHMTAHNRFALTADELNGSIDRLTLFLAATREYKAQHHFNKVREDHIEEEPGTAVDAIESPSAQPENSPVGEAQNEQDNEEVADTLPPLPPLRPPVPLLALGTTDVAQTRTPRVMSARMACAGTPRDHTPRWKDAARNDDTVDPFGDTRPLQGTPRWKEAQRPVDETSDPFGDLRAATPPQPVPTHDAEGDKMDLPEKPSGEDTQQKKRGKKRR